MLLKCRFVNGVNVWLFSAGERIQLSFSCVLLLCKQSQEKKTGVKPVNTVVKCANKILFFHKKME